MTGVYILTDSTCRPVSFLPYNPSNVEKVAQLARKLAKKNNWGCLAY